MATYSKKWDLGLLPYLPPSSFGGTFKLLVLYLKEKRKKKNKRIQIQLMTQNLFQLWVVYIFFREICFTLGGKI